MEWLVPILFVLASLAQWWMQRNRQGQEEENQHQPPASRGERSALPRREPPPPEEFGDLGDLLEALGRRRHESPPPTLEPPAPPVLPPPTPAKTTPPERVSPAQIPEPVIVLETPQPAPVFTPFPEAKPSPMGELGAAFALEETPRVTFCPFPLAEKADTSTSHRWAEKLRSPETVRQAVILSEILAPPVALR